MKFIAHRGFSRRFAENSLPAFQAVIEHPCNGRSLIGIELDVHLTRDERIPVMHETTVRDAGGQRIPVARCSFDELQRLFRREHGPAAPAVPSIEQVLNLVGHRTELCFEIKEAPYDPDLFCRRFAEALAAYRPSGDVVVSSFSFDILERVRPHLARLDLRYGFIFKSLESLECLPAGVRSRFDLLHPHYKLVLHAPEHFAPQGPPIRCWTVNRQSILRRLIARAPQVPIEAVMTDNIELAALFA
jgi:glycerophosphoryl diester phosphodiesterase